MKKAFYSKEEIKLLGEKVSGFILAGDTNTAFQTIKPVLDNKYSFLMLDFLGRKIGEAGIGQPQRFFKVFDLIISYNTMGGFVIASQALISLLENEFERVMRKSREYIVGGDEWYVCDIIGERSLGYALVGYFDKTLPWFERFLEDKNKWVRRSVGVAIHFFSKRVLDEPDKTRRLLNLIEHHIEEKQVDAVKGIGWGLKTIGKHHPNLLTEFLERQFKAGRKMPKLMVRKAITYLDEERRLRLEKHV
ncbi:MAG: DNA alkylation repair protein [Thermoproteota archaeon]